MSSISNVTSNPYPTANQSGSVGQLAQSFQAIGSALQSGDLTSAQTALSAFQQALPGNPQGGSQTSTSQPFGKNSQANTDYQSLTSALKSGNLSNAQQAYSSLQNDLKSTGSTKAAHRGHGHHHHHSSATDPTDSSTATTSAATSPASPTSSSATSSATSNDGGLNVLA